MKSLLDQAQECASRALEGTSEVDLDLLSSLNNMATLYSALGEQDKAEALFDQVLLVLERNASYFQDIVYTFNNLAGVYDAQGQYDEAERLYQQALAIMRNRLGDRHPNTITVAGNYFAFLVALGNIVKATKLFIQFPQILLHG